MCHEINTKWQFVGFETVLEQIFCPKNHRLPPVSVSVHIRVVATATTSFYLRREENKSEKRTERQPDWRMKRVFLFLPPPLTHHHPDSNSRLRRPCASYSPALAGACVTQMEERNTHDQAHVHICTGCRPEGVHHGNRRVRRWSTQVHEQITPRANIYNKGLNAESISFRVADRSGCVSVS